MPSLIAKVLRDKSKVRTGIRQTQKQKIADLKTESTYAYKLKQDFRQNIDKYLDDDNVKAVRIVIPPNYLSVFLKVVFREEFSEYKITQLADREFEVTRKEIYL